MNTILLLTFLACGSSPSAEPEAASPSATEEAAEAPGADAPGADDPKEAHRSDVKAPGNLPVRTRAELAAQSDAREACIESCVQERSMEASPIETIRATCARTCNIEHDMGQVEVSDGPIGLPPPTPPG